MLISLVKLAETFNIIPVDFLVVGAGRKIVRMFFPVITGGNFNFGQYLVTSILHF